MWVGGSVAVDTRKSKIDGEPMKQCLVTDGKWRQITWLPIKGIKNNPQVLEAYSLTLIRCRDCSGLHEQSSISRL